MSELQLQMLTAHFEQLRRYCDTPEKARAQLQLEGLLDAQGRTAPKYRAVDEDAVWP